MAKLAEAFGARDRVVLVHAPFAEEWQDALDAVRAQSNQFELPLEVVSRGERLLDSVRRRGKWPAATQRSCTSDFKRAPIDRGLTRLASLPRAFSRYRKVRVLNVMGIRAQAFPARAKKAPFQPNARRTTRHRVVDQWFQIFTLTERDVWP